MPEINEEHPRSFQTGFFAGVLRRDLLILPFISLLTVLAMLGTSEVGARLLWPEQSRDECEVRQANDVTFRSNCRSIVKGAEGPWVENSYNDCGYRTAESCASDKLGIIRVATIGSSISYGYHVPYDQAYPALTSASLTKQCAQPVEFQNTGAPLRNLLTAYRHLDDALALKPDMIIFTVDPYDVQINDMRADLEANLDAPIAPSSASKAPETPGFLKRYLVIPLKQSRAIFMIQHQFYMDPASYLKLYLLYGDSGSGYLNSAPSSDWQNNFRNLDLIVSAMVRKTNARNVPLVILAIPSAAQVAMQHIEVRAGLDPESFARQVAAIASAHGARFVDALPAMADSSNPMGLFYVADGHLGPEGQSRISRALDEQLRSGRFPLFANCGR